MLEQNDEHGEANKATDMDIFDNVLVMKFACSAHEIAIITELGKCALRVTFSGISLSVTRAALIRYRPCPLSTGPGVRDIPYNQQLGH